jgi:hypothetical protein
MPTMTETRPMISSEVADLSDVSLGDTSVLSEAALKRMMREMDVELAEEPSRFQSSI